MYICLYIYMCSFHWILLIICVESSKFIVFDSKRKNRENPTHHRPIEQVSLICLIKSFSFFDQLNIGHIFTRRVWKRFVKKHRGQGQWKDELTVRMDFPVCGVVTILHISFGALYMLCN
jgi:hypothetical protein